MTRVPRTTRILVVDDEPNIRELLTRVLRREGYWVDQAANGQEAMYLFRRAHYDVVLTDLKMPGMSGVDVLREVKKLSRDTEVIVITGYASKASAVEALDLGAHAYLIKPFDCLDVIPLMTIKSIERQNLLRENRMLINQLRRYLAQRKRELMSLEEITEAMASMEDHEHLLEEMVGRVCRVLRASAAVFWVRQKDMLVLKYQVGLAPDTAETARNIPVGAGPVGRCAVRARMTTVQDLKKHGGIAGLQHVDGRKMNRLYLLPVAISGHVHGVLGVAFPPRRQVKKEEKHRMKSFSHQFSLVLKMMTLYRDILVSHAELKKAQQLLIQSESLSAMGQLASGIAHELGNPLGIIATTTDYLLETEVSRKDSQECLQVMKEQIEHMNGFILDMLELARPKDYQFVTADLGSLVRNAVRFINTRLKANGVAVVHDIEPELPLVRVDKAKMTQVFLNIMLNAADAMPGGGELTITVRSGGTPGEVEVLFSDTGPGIPAADLQKIFTPFFSMKRGGTGLGLSISRQITNRHHGVLLAENGRDGGAVFTVRLLTTQRGGSDEECSDGGTHAGGD